MSKQRTLQILVASLVVCLVASTSAFALGAIEVPRGDINGDTMTNIGDVVYLLEYLFLSGPAPFPYFGPCPNGDFIEIPGVVMSDYDGSGATDIGDVVYLLDFLFLGGAAPIPVFVDCP